MSWDVMMIRTKTNSEVMEELKEENLIPFTISEITDEIENLAKITNAKHVSEDIKYQMLIHDDWSIVFDIGDDQQVIPLSIRGKEEPKVVLKQLQSDLQTRLLDVGSGDFLSDDTSSTFEDWKELLAKS